jgi:hypothetical protein
VTWSTPPTFTDGAVLTGAQLNLLRDDLNETAPAKATASGQLFASTGSNAIAARTPTYASAGPTTETTTSTSYTGTLSSSSGPSVTVTTGTKAMVWIGSQLRNSVAGTASQVSYAVSGATTIAADDQWAITFAPATAGGLGQFGGPPSMQSSLTPGSNTFTLNYKVAGASTGTFAYRAILVIPL